MEGFTALQIFAFLSTALFLLCTETPQHSVGGELVVFQHGNTTVRQRSHTTPQLACVAGDACATHHVHRLACFIQYPESGIAKMCTRSGDAPSVPHGVRVEELHVTCEGLRYDGDHRFNPASCGAQYALYYDDSPYKQYDEVIAFASQEPATGKDFLKALISVLLLALLLGLHVACSSKASQPQRRNRCMRILMFLCGIVWSYIALKGLLTSMYACAFNCRPGPFAPMYTWSKATCQTARWVQTSLKGLLG